MLTLIQKTNKMKHLFVPYELALKLKEKGFDEPCFGAYFNSVITPDEFELNLDLGMQHDYFLNINLLNNACAAPLYQQLIDWFREKHNTHIEIRVTKTWDADHWLCYVLKIIPRVLGYSGIKYEYDSVYDPNINKMTYYQCLNKAIEEAINFIQ